MAMNWFQGGQSYGHGSPSSKSGQGYQNGRHTGPPPICFNCGVPGHFVAECSAPRKQLPDGLVASRVNNPALGPQWQSGNQQQYPAPTHPVQQYSQQHLPPDQSQYAISHPPYDHQSSYQQYQAYSGPTQLYPSYDTAHQSYPQNVVHQQYSAPAFYNSASTPQQYAQQGPYGSQTSQPQQAQHSPGPAWQHAPQQYGQHHQSAQQSQYSGSYVPHGYQRGPEQWSGPPPPSVQQGHTHPSMQQQQASQWFNPQHQRPLQQPMPQTQDVSKQQAMRQNAQPHLTPHLLPQSQERQTAQEQINALHHSQVSTASTLRSASHHSQADRDASGMRRTTQHSQSFRYAKDPSGSITVQNSPTESQIPPPSATSASSSPPGTPYVRYLSAASNIDKHGGRSMTPPQRGTSRQGHRTGKIRSAEEEQFNWDFKHIFKDEEIHETIAIGQTLSSLLGKATPTPLLDSKTKQTVSRNARVDNFKEYIQSIRKSPQWPYLQQDPIFQDLPEAGILVPLHDVQTWMEARHGSDAVPLEQRRASETRRKRSRAEIEQHDGDAEAESGTDKYSKRQRVLEPHQEGKVADFTKERTPTVERSGTPYLGTADDDAWVPRREDSSMPDPTEALLASLGVTGKAKPMKSHQNSQTRLSSQCHHDAKQISEDDSRTLHEKPSKRKDSGYSTGSKDGVKMCNRHSGEPSVLNGSSRSGSQTTDEHPPPPPPPPPMTESQKQELDSSSETREDSSPLSPTSREILGQLGAPAESAKPRKIIRVISGRRHNETIRQEDDVTPRYRRSQPVVQEAYSRRW